MGHCKEWFITTVENNEIPEGKTAMSVFESNEDATVAPSCCGEVVYVTLSPRVSYHYCRGCKKEVSQEAKKEAALDEALVALQELELFYNKHGGGGTPSSPTSPPPPSYL